MNNYKSLYSDLKFERKELFQLIRETYACREVLYPGCSIHITPSLYFPHVVYVDQSQAAAQFFAEEKAVLEFVNRNKTYKQSAYIRFIRQDYSTPLPVRDGSYDLLLALFTGGVSTTCTRYLKAGGTLITNNHQGDALDAAHDDRLEFRAIIRFDTGRYRVVEANLASRKIASRKPGSRDLAQMSKGMEYKDNETYYVFKRMY